MTPQPVNPLAAKRGFALHCRPLLAGPGEHVTLEHRCKCGAPLPPFHYREDWGIADNLISICETCHRMWQLKIHLGVDEGDTPGTYQYHQRHKDKQGLDKP